ncbi:hypothetical protein SLEP1_g55676 [Rubroshorea leprosula]|uniref:Uncharacterized protein n=1 Tax=Rubroshorea leprosula TaxID=152421 RepID=A0AAV5MJ45_9ROSI|nr:hypothetical protein SLEP1_g55676 [Rubroshorea leprosula]
MLPNYFFALRTCSVGHCTYPTLGCPGQCNNVFRSFGYWFNTYVPILVLLATQDLSDFSSQGQNVMQYLCLLLISGGSTLATKPIR